MNTDQNDPVVIAATAAQERQRAKAGSAPATAENAKNTAIHEARAEAERQRIAAEESKRRADKKKLNAVNQGEG